MTVIDAVANSVYTLTDFLDDLEGAPDCNGAFSATNPVNGATWGGVKELYRSNN